MLRQVEWAKVSGPKAVLLCKWFVSPSFLRTESIASDVPHSRIVSTNARRYLYLSEFRRPWNLVFTPNGYDTINTNQVYGGFQFMGVPKSSMLLARISYCEPSSYWGTPIYGNPASDLQATQKTTYWLPDGKAGGGDVALLKLKAPPSLPLYNAYHNVYSYIYIHIHTHM